VELGQEVGRSDSLFCMSTAHRIVRDSSGCMMRRCDSINSHPIESYHGVIDHRAVGSLIFDNVFDISIPEELFL
jgi:hypothetical protein